jgi:serine/threonine protein kinase
MRAADSAKTLRDELVEGQHRADVEMFQAAKRCLECVAAVHHQQYVHCDIKPEHFMRFDGRLMLIDFGSARIVPAAVHSEITPDYAAPELWQSLEEFRAAAMAAAAPAASRRGRGALGRSKTRTSAAAALVLLPPPRRASSDAGWSRVPERVRRRDRRAPRDSVGARASGVAKASAKPPPPPPHQHRRGAAASAPATSALQLHLHPGMDVWSAAVTLCFVFRMTQRDIADLRASYSPFADLNDILPVERIVALAPSAGRAGAAGGEANDEIERRASARLRIVASMLKAECDKRPTIRAVLRKKYFCSDGFTDTLQQSHIVVLALFSAPTTCVSLSGSALPATRHSFGALARSVDSPLTSIFFF